MNVRVCHVHWIDSQIAYEQIGAHELPTPTHIHSVGFVVEETDEYVTLSLEILHGEDYRCVVSIPRPAIVGITTVTTIRVE